MLVALELTVAELEARERLVTAECEVWSVELCGGGDGASSPTVSRLASRAPWQVAIPATDLALPAM